MEMLWALASVQGAVVLEYGCKGHALYAQSFLARAGLEDAAQRLFSTHLAEADIVFGGGERLFTAAEELATRSGVEAIFLLPSVVPMVTGFDLKAAVRLQEQFAPVRVIAFNAGSLDAPGTIGLEQALLTLARELATDDVPISAAGYNILGASARPFQSSREFAELETQIGALTDAMQAESAMIPLNIVTGECSVASLKALGAARLNIVLIDEALPVARYLEQRFSTPWRRQDAIGQWEGCTERA
jgi:nitrogenase molybdenum-iron protein alpha/beta subunit